MRLLIYYETTNLPWGGVNSFIRSFKEYIQKNRKDIVVVNSLGDNPDVVLLSAAQAGPGKEVNIREIRRILRKGDSFFQRIFGNTKRKIALVHRLDGLRAVYSDKMIPNDRRQIELSRMADFIIFQSEFSLQNFQQFGYIKDNYKIINNGVNQDIFNYKKKVFRDIKKVNDIRILSASWSENLNKGFETIAKFSEVEGVRVLFVGRWNKDVDRKNVEITAPLDREMMAEMYRDCDVFLHAAKNDPCPNVIFEAVSCGLPVIYHNSGGTKEIAASYGVPLPLHIDVNTATATVSRMKDDYETLRNRIIQDWKTFSIEHVVEKYIDAIESVLEKMN